VPLAPPAVTTSVAGVTVKLRWTWPAAFQLASPAWSALTVQVPVATNVSVVPDTVHTPVVADVNATVSPALDVPVSVSGEADSDASESGAKVIVCAPLAIVPATVAPVALTGTPWLSVARTA
jgi:hypothetical protein